MSEPKAAAHVQPPHPPVDGLIAQSRAAHTAGRHLAGAELAQQAVQLALDGNDALLLAQAYSQLASHRWRLGQFELAVLAARSAAARWEAIGGREECDNLCLLAIAYSELGLHEEALKAATAAFDKSRSNRFDLQTAQALNRIGVCFDRLGDPEQSEKFLLQSLGQARELGDNDQVLGALNNLMATTISAFYHSAPAQPRPRDREAPAGGAHRGASARHAGRPADPPREPPACRRGSAAHRRAGA